MGGELVVRADEGRLADVRCQSVIVLWRELRLAKRTVLRERRKLRLPVTSRRLSQALLRVEAERAPGVSARSLGLSACR